MNFPKPRTHKSLLGAVRYGTLRAVIISLVPATYLAATLGGEAAARVLGA